MWYDGMVRVWNGKGSPSLVVNIFKEFKVWGNKIKIFSKFTLLEDNRAIQAAKDFIWNDSDLSEMMPVMPQKGILKARDCHQSISQLIKV